MSSRHEPLLWLQLAAFGAIPLELQLLRLILAGSDLGPVPPIERLLCWGIAVVAPTILLWKRPVDWGSLLMVRQSLEKRTIRQRKISQIQDNLLLKALGACGSVLILAVFWWIDGSSLLVADISPFKNGHRLNSLLIATPLLAVITWQWHQLVQAIWLLTRSTPSIDASAALSHEELLKSRFSLGFNTLRLSELDWNTSAPKPSEAAQQAQAFETKTTEQHLDGVDEGPSADEPNTSQDIDKPIDLKASESRFTASIEPEQASEHNDSSNLDDEVTGDDFIASSNPEGHDEQTQPSGSEESEPEQAP